MTTADAIAELSRALWSQAEVEAAEREAHLLRFKEPKVAWVKDERNGRMRKVTLPFPAEPDLAELLQWLGMELEPRSDLHKFTYYVPTRYAVAKLLPAIGAILAGYPERSKWEYHAHGWAVSLSRSPCHFRPYTPE